MKNAPVLLTTALVLSLTLGTLAVVAGRAEFASGLAPADWAALRFTISQAAVSAVLSVALAVPVARALARRRFTGRRVMIALLGAPFILPVIVAILGLLAVFGRNGLFNQALEVFGITPLSIYGFHGVVLAHMFFNLPLAVRFILQGWVAIPAERYRLAASLRGSVFWLLEWPMLRRVLPGAALVIFLICLTSFAVALTLGGGPRATTVELAIYQAIRFDFDLGRAALLATLQVVICATAAVLAWRVTPIDGFGAGLDRVIERWDLPHRVWDQVPLALAFIFVALPLAMVVWRGVPGLVEMPVSVWQAAARSVVVALASCLLCAAMALALAMRGGFALSVIGVLPLAASGLVMGTGLFLIVHPFLSVRSVALPVTVLVNATLALPFAVRILTPAVADVRMNYGRLAASLNITGWAALRLVILPRVWQPLGFATGLAAALSMGDLGVIALFAGEAEATLPLAMYRLMGAYRMDAAAGAGLLLVTLSFALFWAFDRGGRMHVDA